MTQNERINNMTIKEKADFICKCSYTPCCYCKYKDTEKCRVRFVRSSDFVCKQGVIEYLESEVNKNG